MEEETFSDCCGVSTIETEMGICPDCLEHCEFITGEDKMIGEYLMSFSPKGMADCKSPNTYKRTFTKEGEYDAFIEEMDSRGYHFHDCWEWGVYKRSFRSPEQIRADNKKYKNV
tara:strand:+ start:1557 stop:1898 length:342 start_codon:yes stop_codon:yes gene_type:complete